MQWLEPESHKARNGITAELLPDRRSTLRGRRLTGASETRSHSEA